MEKYENLISEIKNGVARKVFASYVSGMSDDLSHGVWLCSKQDELKDANAFEALDEISKMDSSNRSLFAQRVRVTNVELESFLKVLEHIQLYDDVEKWRA